MSFSQAEIVVLRTFNMSANSFCVIPFSFLNCFNFIPNFFILILYKKYEICLDIPKNMEYNYNLNEINKYFFVGVNIENCFLRILRLQDFSPKIY